MKNPLVSIIITTYNYARFLPTAVESALSQTYPRLEVIVVDDGSTDNTQAVIQPFLEQVTYIHQSNSGVVQARNNGFNMSKGEYILFLDADDLLDPGYVEQLIPVLMQQADKAFAYTDIDYFGAVKILYRSRQWDISQLMLSNYVGLSSLIRKTAYERIGGFDNTFNRSADFEDWDLWLSFAQAGLNGIYVADGLTYHHRTVEQGSRNMVGRVNKIKLRSRLISKHRNMYFRPRFLVLLPINGLRMVGAKLRYKKQVIVH